MKEIEDDTKKWKDIPCSQIEELMLLKYTYYLKQSTDLIQFYQNIHDTFHRTRTNNPKIYVEHKRPQIAKAILTKKEQSWKYHAP